MIRLVRAVPAAALALALVLACGGAGAAQQRDRAMLHVSQDPLLNDEGQPLAG